ncbi:MAG: GntR family transcriptional regulator [Pseudonocardiales bacterium]|nr:MAG: GntR family transcriptional regulator [Pseudonocardiales bacterium]
MPVRYSPTGSTAKEIAAGVERAVSAGSLGPGVAILPIRLMAAELGVNPNTVAAAYRLLRERGIVEAAGRRGTRVRSRPPVTPVERRPLEIPPGVRDLSDGRPAIRLQPRLAGHLRRGALAAAGRGYGDGDVAAGLAAGARAMLDADRVPSDHLAVTHSTLDAVERVLRAHLRAGDRVAVEDPAWANLTDLLAALGLVAEPVAVDDDGVLAEPLRRALAAGVRAVVVTTRAQVPIGAATSSGRARELRRVLSAHPAVLLVEDDHAAGIAGVAPAPLAGATGSWAYVRSVSKAWGADLRLAVLVGDATTVGRVRAHQALGPGWVSHAVQEAVADLWGDERATALVRRAEGEYADRRSTLIGALAERGVRAHGRSGVNVWVPVRDETTAVSALLGQGWAVAAGSRFRLATPPGLRITVATLTAAEVGPLADAVGRAATSAISRGI